MVASAVPRDCRQGRVDGQNDALGMALTPVNDTAEPVSSDFCFRRSEGVSVLSHRRESSESRKGHLVKW